MMHRKPGLLSRHYLEKVAIPVWTHIPGTPFTLAGDREKKERLPGMVDWAPRSMITDVAQGLREGRGPQELADEQSRKGLLGDAGTGAVAGGTLGAVAGRLLGGSGATAPFQKLWAKGLTGAGLKGLSKIPMVSKLSPLIGAGLGAGIGLLKWKGDAASKGRQAMDVSKGLLAEKVIQDKALSQARGGGQQPSRGLLNNMGQTTATAPIPHVLRYGHLG